MTLLKNLAATCAATISFCLITAQTATADDWPVTLGNYMTVTEVKLKEGQAFNYLNHLATEWKRSMEFQKSKGWIVDYLVLGNSFSREGEPDIYLIEIYKDIPEGSVLEAQAKEWREWHKSNISELMEDREDRAEYRTIMGERMLARYNFRN